MRTFLLLIGIVLLTACTGIPDGVTVVQPFNAERYLGKWYEIKRLDHSFERGLSQVSAEYSANADGSIKVINRGFNAKKHAWQEAEGRAKFIGARDVGALKVSFFGPFYGSYNVIALDPDYQWSLVSGPDRSYLWLLARTPTLAPETQAAILQKASELGFDVSQLLDGQ